MRTLTASKWLSVLLVGSLLAGLFVPFGGGSAKAASFDYTKVPELLITELVPDSTNVSGSDGYEFIEVYNNSQSTIDFSDYQIVYTYETTATAWPLTGTSVSASVYIPSKQSAVFWVMNSANKTLESSSFTGNYGNPAGLTDGENLFRVEGGGGMHNSQPRTIVIQDADGNEVVSASYENDDQTKPDKGIFYSYPTDGSTKMKMVASGLLEAGTAAATPGSVEAALVPAFTHEEPDGASQPDPGESALRIDHSPIAEASATKDLAISATVVGGSAFAGAKLKYKTGSQSTFTSLEMTRNGAASTETESIFEAVVPKESLTEESLQYSIEAVDVVSAFSTDVYSVSVTDLADEDLSKQPPLLITELVPDSADVTGTSTDAYEFIEVYNNSDRTLNLKDYKLIYRYTNKSPAEDKQWETGNVPIPSGQAVALWIINSGNGSYTEADFNANYGTGLTLGTNLFRISNDGMANGGNRSLVLQNAAGQDLAVAHYSNDAETVPNMGITYHYPVSGSADMIMMSAGTETGTPGSAASEQVPAVRVDVPEMPVNQPPVITHTPVKTVSPDSPLTISASVVDPDSGSGEADVLTVALYYKSASQTTFSSIAMGVKSGNSYEAQIPKSAFAESTLQYYIEAKDAGNTIATDTYSVSVELGDFDPSKVPPLLVTELVPDSTNAGSADGYEFIEIYNNSDKAINLKDYKIYYRYTDSGPDADVVWPTDNEEMIIPSQQAFVFWIINSQNTMKTAADFNANYGTSLTENVNLFRVYSDGMANGSKRGVAIGTNTHVDVSAAYYDGSTGVVAANKGIFYKYPINGSTEMIMTGGGVLAATPGQVSEEQVPQVPVTLPEDATDPVVKDTTGVAEVAESANLTLSADASDELGVKSVALYYKNDAAADYTKRYLYLDYDNQDYSYVLYSPELIGHSYMEYYYVVSDGTNEVASDKFKVNITGGADRSPLRLNVKDGAFINGIYLIKGTAENAGPDSLTMKIDGEDVSPSTYHALENDATFAFEANSVNYYFKNGVTIGQEILYTFQDPINTYTTLSVPISANRLKLGDNAISIRAGSKSSPFDDRVEENKDDFDVRNVRLVLADGTSIYDADYAVPSQAIKMGDGSGRTPALEFSFNLPDSLLKSKAYSMDTTTLTDGEHTIQVTGPDNLKAEATVKVDNTAPSIVPSVEEGQTYRGAFELSAQITDALSGVKTIEATLDGQAIELPYAVSSSKLGEGSHVLAIKVTDNVGNVSEKTVAFDVPEENPLAPEAIVPANDQTGVDLSGKLTVKAEDPTGDAMKVSFYRGYKYDATHRTGIAGYRNASDVEPPKTIAADGEQALTDEDWAKIAAEDGAYLVEDSTEKFPYHRFDVQLDKSVQAGDEVVIDWKGKSLEGRKVSLYAWSPSEGKYVQLDSKVAGTGDFALTATVKAGDFSIDNKIHVMVQDERPVSEDPYDFSFVWMSDTQYYSESYPDIYKNNTQWIVDNQEAMNIKYVLHTGDLVDDWDQEYQWDVADEAMSTLDNAGIPYGVLAGNHDVDHQYSDYTQYYNYFGEDRFKDSPVYGGSYLNNRGHYDLISAGGVDFIAVYMGWDIRDEDIEWVNQVLKQYPDRKAILNFHEYLLVSANRAPISDVIYEKVVVPNKNVFMVLSGHYHDAEDKIDYIDDDGDGTADREVHQILADYQGAEKGGLGYIRLLQFDTANNKVHVKTYSPLLDDYNYYDPAEYPGKDEFDINADLRAMDKQVATDYFGVKVYSSDKIGEAGNVASGSTATVYWNGLQPNNFYQWYVTAEDTNSGYTRSDIWSFSTGNWSPTPIPNPNPNPNPDSNSNTPDDNGSDSDNGSDTEEPSHPNPSTPSSNNPFKDIEGTVDWAKEAIGTLYQLGIIKGTSATTFEPKKNISRGDFLTLLVRMLDLKAEFSSSFSDVNPNDYYYNELGIVKALGIANGTGDGKFNPKEEITRQDMMVLLSRALKIGGKLDLSGAATDLGGYRDGKSVSGYAKDAVAQLVGANIVQGDGQNLHPKEQATRAETAQLLYRIYKLLNE